MMESQELRARALDAAVRIGAAWKMESAGDIVATARVFEQYLIGHLHQLQGSTPVKARFLNDPSPHDVGHAEDIWGPPCNGCTHSTGVHVSSGCTDPECGCTRMSGECAQPSAPEPTSALQGCTCPTPHRIHDPLMGCVECLCRWTGSAPAERRKCECGHYPWVHAALNGGCTRCECTFSQECMT